METPITQNDGDPGIRPEGAIERAIRLAGGPTALARALRERGHDKVNSHATVNAWVDTGSVPAKYCPDIEDLTGVRCEDLDDKTNWGLVRDRRSQPRTDAGGATQEAR